MAQKQLRDGLENILEAARAQLWESGRRGEGGGWEEAAEYESGSKRYWYDGTETRDSGVDI